GCPSRTRARGGTAGTATPSRGRIASRSPSRTRRMAAPGRSSWTGATHASRAPSVAAVLRPGQVRLAVLLDLGEDLAAEGVIEPGRAALLDLPGRARHHLRAPRDALAESVRLLAGREAT